MAAEMAAGDTGMYVCTRFSLLTADVLTYFSLSDSLRHALFAVSFNRLLANKGLESQAGGGAAGVGADPKEKLLVMGTAFGFEPSLGVSQGTPHHAGIAFRLVGAASLKALKNPEVELELSVY